MRESRLRRPLRVLHCPTNTAGNPGALARAEREIGLESWAVTIAGSPFGFPCDETLWESGSPWRDHLRMRRRLLWRALRHYDVIHYNWGTTIYPLTYPPAPWLPQGHKRSVRGILGPIVRRAVGMMEELALLRAAGKVIAVTFQGDDARQGDFIRSHFAVSPADFVEESYYTAESDTRKRLNIGRFDRYADLIYSVATDVLAVLPPRAQFLPYATVDPREWIPLDPEPQNSVPLIVHAPSHRGVKGTRLVLEAVEQLRREGIAFEFMLIENMSHDEAKALYRRADLLIDQLLVGNYGALAVELMALGVPVIVYMRDSDVHALPAPMRDEIPVINATPVTITAVLRDKLSMPRERLRALGLRGRRFIEKWYDPRETAARTSEDYARAYAAKSRLPRSR